MVAMPSERQKNTASSASAQKPVDTAVKMPHSALKPISIHDVAARAGVSTATVSRVLNNPELVAEATSSRVRDAIDALGYRPNLFAKGLMTKRSSLIGLVVPPKAEGAWCHVVKTAHDEAARLGFRIVLICFEGSADDRVSADFLDGFVVWSEAAPKTEPVPTERIGTLSSVAEAQEKTRAAIAQLIGRILG